MRWSLAVGVAVSTLVLAGGTPAAVQPLPVQSAALHALAVAAAAGRVDAATAASGRAEINRAARLIRNLPAPRGRPVAQCLSQVAALAGKLSQPRAVALLGQLRADDGWFAQRPAPSAKTDIADADGVVYRYFPGRCFEFHPLANFGALNADVAAGDTDAAARLATALAARAQPEPGGGLGWEYYFDFGGGRAPWLSGMAQAVAAQAFVGAAAGDPALSSTAAAAFRTIGARHLLTTVTAGPWIRLYSFSPVVVLNAQLQTVISLQAYATASGDPDAATLAANLQAAAADTLPRFDTGFWSDYSLDGTPSPVDYAEYVAQLLRKLAPADPRFAAAATRFTAYLTEPPALRLANAAVGAARFWLSKPATVQATSSAGATRTLSLDPGWHTVAWKLPARAGLYPVQVTARDWAGNTTTVAALPIVRAAGTTTTTTNSRREQSAARELGGPQVGQPTFVVGAGLDSPTQATAARQLGLAVVRLGVAWPAGASTVDPGLAQALQKVPAGVGIVVELIASPLPADDPGRAALAAYAVALAQQVPAIRDLVLAPAITPATAGASVAALAAIRDAIQTAVPAVGVGALLDGGAAPKTALTALGKAAAATGRPTVLDLLAFRPAAAPGTGLWAAADLRKLEVALPKAFATPPPILVDGLSVPTAIPAAELPLYGAPSTPPTTTSTTTSTTATTTTPTTTTTTTTATNPAAPPSGGSTEADQAAAYAAAISTSSCDPAVAGVILDRLVDAPGPTPTGGLFYPDSTAKTSAAAVGAAGVAAQRGALVCPGFATPATPTSLVFPSALANGSAAIVQLGCSRDCLYLLTLERSDGTPVAARRGALAGGAAPRAIGLPRVALAPGDYTLSVRLVTQTNPGPIALLQSEPLTVS